MDVLLIKQTGRAEQSESFLRMTGTEHYQLRVLQSITLCITVCTVLQVTKHQHLLLLSFNQMTLAKCLILSYIIKALKGPNVLEKSKEKVLFVQNGLFQSVNL